MYGAHLCACTASLCMHAHIDMRQVGKLATRACDALQDKASILAYRPFAEEAPACGWGRCCHCVLKDSCKMQVAGDYAILHCQCSDGAVMELSSCSLSSKASAWFVSLSMQMQHTFKCSLQAAYWAARRQRALWDDSSDICCWY